MGSEMRLPAPATATVTALLASATDAMWKASVAATGKDQLRMNEDVELRPSFGKGMGVFALRWHVHLCMRTPVCIPRVRAPLGRAQCAAPPRA